MNLYLRTRGYNREHDYRFVSAAPSANWWKPYLQLTNEQRPGFVCIGDGTSWRLLMNGIRSARRDASETPIRYTVVVEGRCAERGESELRLLARLDEFLLDASNPSGETGVATVGKALDTAFSREFVEGLFGIDKADSVREVRRRLEGWVGDASPLRVQAHRRASWLGSIHSEECRRAFLQEVATILNGRPGAAGYLTYANHDDGRRLALEHGHAVLLLKDGPTVPESIEQGQTNGVMPAANASSSPPISILIGSTAIVGAIVLVKWFLGW